MLDHGADVNAFDPLGRTPLMYAAVSDVLPLDVVKLLIERGADVNAKDRHKNSGDAGITVLDIAKRNGNQPIIDLLVKAGAKATPEVPVALKPRHDNTHPKRRSGQPAACCSARTPLSPPKPAAFPATTTAWRRWPWGSRARADSGLTKRLPPAQVRANVPVSKRGAT